MKAISATASARKSVSRCRGWAMVVRASEPLPLPEYIKGAASIGRPYTEQYGEDATVELFPGDYLLQGEANHHKRDRGWSYWLYGYDPSGRAVYVDFDSEIKADIKAAMTAGKISAPYSILKGSGDIAAMIRRIHADRGGYLGYIATKKADEEARVQRDNYGGRLPTIRLAKSGGRRVAVKVVFV